MDRGSKILIAIFIVSIFISVFFTYKRSFLDRDFIIVEEEAEEEILAEETEEETQ